MCRNLLLALACSLAVAAAAQPTWRFHLAFEDGTGARDTIWMVYDTSATLGSNPWPGPNVDTLLGEGRVDISDGQFHVFTYNAVGDTTNTNAYPYYLYPIFDGTGIDAINWIPPMTITWDTSLFHAPYLPYNQGHFGMAVMSGIAFSQFDQGGMGFGLFNMLIDDHVTIDFLWDYLFPIPVTFWGEDDTGIETPTAARRFLHVWPNPATDKIWIQTRADRMESMFIADAMGRVALQLNTLSATDPLDISSLPPGRYFIHALTDQNHIHHGTFEKIR